MKDIKKIIQGIKEYYISELEKLRNETELGEKLEMKEEK